MTADVTRAEVIAKLAPCGLDCSRCASYSDGVVKRQAAALLAALNGYEDVAANIVEHVPAMAGYAAFVDVLESLVAAPCTGCRAGGAPVPFCAARTCHGEMGVDFCAECAEYPCGRNSYPQSLHARWRATNDRMREVGVEQYYRGSLERPRY